MLGGDKNWHLGGSIILATDWFDLPIVKSWMFSHGQGAYQLAVHRTTSFQRGATFVKFPIELTWRNLWPFFCGDSTPDRCLTLLVSIFTCVILFFTHTNSLYSHANPTLGECFQARKIPTQQPNQFHQAKVARDANSSDTRWQWDDTVPRARG